VLLEGTAFEVVKRVLNVEITNVQDGETELEAIPDNVTLHADFQEVTTKLSNNEQLEKEQFDLDNDLADRVTILMERNSDLTEDQAIAELKMIDDRKSEDEEESIPDEEIISFEETDDENDDET